MSAKQRRPVLPDDVARVCYPLAAPALASQLDTARDMRISGKLTAPDLSWPLGALKATSDRQDPVVRGAAARWAIAQIRAALGQVHQRHDAVESVEQVVLSRWDPAFDGRDGCEEPALPAPSQTAPER